MSGCRIGKVRLKGGAILHRLPPPELDADRDALIQRAVKAAGYYKEGELGGYVIVTWGMDGTYTTAYYHHKDSVVGAGLLPSFIADAMRRRLIEEGEWES